MTCCVFGKQGIAAPEPCGEWRADIAADWRKDCRECGHAEHCHKGVTDAS